MNDSALARFFGVVTRPQTWLGILFHVLAFPLGLFYFVFLVTGLSVGVGLVVVWIGIPILLVVVGAWWLFAAFERLQAQHLLGARVPPEPRPWEAVDGVWGKLKAHFGAGSTWLDLAYLVAKLALGTASFTLLVTLGGAVFWLLAVLVFAVFRVPMVNATWVPPLWLGILCVPLGILAFFASLHVVNAWSWVCARWAELLFRGPAQPGTPAAAAPVAPTAQPPAAPVAPTAQPPAPPAESLTPPVQPPVQAAAAPPASPPAPGSPEPRDEAVPSESAPDDDRTS